VKVGEYLGGGGHDFASFVECGSGSASQESFEVEAERLFSDEDDFAFFCPGVEDSFEVRVLQSGPISKFEFAIGEQAGLVGVEEGYLIKENFAVERFLEGEEGGDSAGAMEVFKYGVGIVFHIN
jgi:hypothetical protein